MNFSTQSPITETSVGTAAWNDIPKIQIASFKPTIFLAAATELFRRAGYKVGADRAGAIGGGVFSAGTCSAESSSFRLFA
jgi:hypothetical protein